MDASRISTCVDERALQRHIVQIKDVTGVVLGTGFFASPGRILTNAHVVGERTEVILRPEVPADIAEGKGKVAACSEAQLADQPLWPFPDLAVIVTADFPDHGCVLVDDRPITMTNRLDQLKTWGYPQRNGEVIPAGDTASFKVVGHGSRDQPYLRVDGGWVGRGLSGAPVVSLDRGAVIGVVAATLDPRGPAGGWVTPLTELHKHPTLNPGLAQYLVEIVADSQSAVVADPGRWSTVTTLAGIESVSLVNEADPCFSRGAHSSPAELLIADNCVVEYLFYDAEVDQAFNWAIAPDPVRVAVVAGSGGAGKTRFALEVAKRLHAIGWVTIELPLDNETARTVSFAPVPRLFVVDYAETRGADVEELIKRLLVGSTPAAPARVILLSRDDSRGQVFTGRRPTTVPRSRDPRVNRVLGDRLEMSSTTSDLSLDDRQALFNAAVPCLARAWGSEVPTRRAVDLTGDQYATALAVIYEALDTILALEATAVTLAPNPADRILEHEARYWALSAPNGVTPERVAQTVALATLFTGDTSDDLVAPIAHLGVDWATAKDLADWAARLYGPGPAVQPLRPDRLGEHLIEQVLVMANTVPTLETFLDVASDTQWARAVEVLGRAATFFPTMRQTLIHVLRSITPALQARARAHDAGPLAASMIDLFTGPHGPEILGDLRPGSPT